MSRNKDKLMNTKQLLAGKNPHEALAMIISFYSLSVIETYNISISNIE